AGYGAWAFYDAGSRIFVADTNGAPEPTGTAGAYGFNRDDYLATPDATPADPNARITVLFTGIDSGPNRDHALTDTMLVVSLDPKTGKVIMVSFPRDLAFFPLYFGGTYPNKINTMMTVARKNPAKYVDGP